MFNKKLQEELDLSNTQIRQLEIKIKELEDSVSRSMNSTASTLTILTETVNKTSQKEMDLTRSIEILKKVNDSYNDSLIERINEVKSENKGIIKIINVLHKSIEKLNASILDNKKTIEQKSGETDKKNLETTKTVAQIGEKLEIAVDVLLDKIAEKAIYDTSKLPKELIENKCPFKPKHGYCEIWKNRPNKSDGIVYCASCLRISELAYRGIKL